MFLVDSSAWIEYLRPRGNAKVRAFVRDLLEREEAAVCGIVITEVLRGVKEDKAFDALKDTFFALPRLPLGEEEFERAANMRDEIEKMKKLIK